MNYYLKVYLKRAALGAGVLSVAGAACGAVAGIAGLNQMCSVEMQASDMCERQLLPLIIPYAEKAAAVAGATMGAVTGAAIGALVYPAYTGFIGWCYRGNPEEEMIVAGERAQRLNI